jgi:hypothetical protein
MDPKSDAIAGGAKGGFGTVGHIVRTITWQMAELVPPFDGNGQYKGVAWAEVVG